MNSEQVTLIVLAEECQEVAQRVTKALRFGLNETQVGKSENNAERIMLEFADLLGVYELLVESGALFWPDRDAIAAKRQKVLKYLEYSKQCGVLVEKKEA